MKIFHRILQYRNNNNINVLCASAYLPLDLSLMGFPMDRCYKWGYFPQKAIYDNLQVVINNKLPDSILWVGRLIKWKHPEVAIELASQLKKEGFNFSLSLIGDGELKEEIERMVESYHLQNCVKLLGSMTPAEVRESMEKHKIFLFTSDQNEGWGAVLNESMNSACAVVASHLIGSVPFMIKHNENGLIYNSGDDYDLFHKVRYLLVNKERCNEMARNAYNTIIEEWNAETAVSRLMHLITDSFSYSKVNDSIYLQGPCSNVEVLEEIF